MNAALLTLALLAPLVLAFPSLSAKARFLPAVAALPALLAALLVPLDTVLDLPWLLFGTRFGLDQTGQVFLLGSALIWLSASLYASETLAGAGRFRVFFMLAMAGNFGLVLAQDAIAFYLGFALMGLAAAGLVAERNAAGTRPAARSYLAWTIVGEVALFAALVMLVSGASGYGFEALRAAGASRTALFLLLVGFGIKVALPGLHPWMPQAYQAAPAAGSAVLGGAMVNAGVLGWLRLLPTGEPGYADWGYLLFVLGLAGAFYGVLFGLVQRRPKVVLAYSSMSQMGLLSAAIGLALAEPRQAPLLLGAVTLYALHHGLAKGALFLATDAYGRRGAPVSLFVLLVILALTLAGGPLTSGALAKGAYKAALPGDMDWLGIVLTASTLATTLLMSRFLLLVWRPASRTTKVRRAPVAPILLPVAAGLLLAWLPARVIGAATVSVPVWPVLAGIALAALVAWRPVGILRHLVGMVPPGDLPVLFAHHLRIGLHRIPAPTMRLPSPDLTALPATPADAETRLRRWPVAGALWLSLLIALILVLLHGP
jgi:formate hydrogenlyase subunit 3/multisubunit Na+/H+ antiporter MnhD subunit